MTPEENELRRALEARSAAPSPEFRSRLSQALSARPASPNLMPAIAFATAIVLTATSVGILVAARHLGRSNQTVASGARAETPSPVPPGGFNFQLSAPSASVVWALYDPDKLYRSTDGGNSWQIRSMPSGFGVHPKISFINDQEGWWLAPSVPATQCQEQDATIWHTTDAGASWHQAPFLGLPSGGCKDGIWFFDSKHGFVTVHDPNNRPTIYRTANGGDGWTAMTLQDPAYFKSAPGGFTLQVAWMKQVGSTTYMEVFGSQDDPNLPHDNQFILKSSDGGATWAYVTKVASRSTVMVTESRWLDLESNNQSMESLNGGQQFHPFTTDFIADASGASQVVFADSQTGFASGPGYMQRTVDGGSHWTRLAAPGAAMAASPSPGVIPMPSNAVLSAPTANVVWALVGSQYLFRSTDQGRTWQQEALPANGFFTDVSFVDQNDGWVFTGGPAGTQCSSGGATLWQTTDAGAHWAVLAGVDAASSARTAGSIAPEQCKESLSFIDREDGFLDSWDDNGAPSIYRSTDGGMTWSRSRLSDPPGFTTLGAGDTLRAGHVKAFGATLLVDASGMQPDGLHSYVFQSTDGGASWSYLANGPNNARFPQLSFLTPTRWLEMPDGFETTDAGKTWHTFTYHDEEAAGVPSTFVFADDKVGYATVRGDIRRTVDGGANFVQIKSSWP